MLFLTKKKPKLNQLIPVDLVDIHNHVLPNLDDGSKNIGETQALLSNMKELGIKSCIATPHTMHGVWDNTPDGIKTQFLKTKEELPSTNSDMLKSCASEYMMDYEFLQNIGNKNLLTLKDNMVLVEMSFMEAPNFLFDIISELMVNNYKPILAHPERYFFYHRDFHLYEELKDYEIKFQMNLLSATGYYGNDVAKVADKLLKKGFYDFVGSDIHSHKHILHFDDQVVLKNVDELETIMENNIKVFS